MILYLNVLKSCPPSSFWLSSIILFLVFFTQKFRWSRWRYKKSSCYLSGLYKNVLITLFYNSSDVSVGRIWYLRNNSIVIGRVADVSWGFYANFLVRLSTTCETNNCHHQIPNWRQKFQNCWSYSNAL
jgi:hypothetical protein